MYLFNPDNTCVGSVVLSLLKIRVFSSCVFWANIGRVKTLKITLFLNPDDSGEHFIIRWKNLMKF